MALLASDCYKHIEHGLSGKPSELYPLQEILNDAGEWLLSAHQWEWSVPGPALLGVTQDQEYVELPADFRELIAIQPTENLTSSICPTTRTRLLEMRTNPVTVTSSFYQYVVGYRQISGDTRPVLELWPTPSATEADVLTVWYRKTWARVTTDSQAIDFPTWMEGLFKRVCRLFAQAAEEEDSSAPAGRRNDLDDLLDRLMAGTVWRTAVEQDSSLQPMLGPMQGGHTMTATRSANFLWTPVQGPS